MIRTHNLGFPRIGQRRELKQALEAYWSHRIERDELLDTGRRLRASHWRLQSERGIDLLPLGDFSFYDHVLDMTMLLGAVPERFGGDSAKYDLDLYFAMARGTPSQPAMEMTKWFDTNYHYIVPELTSRTQFRLNADPLLEQIRQAQTLGLEVKPVLVGPLTFLFLAKEKEPGFERLSLLSRLLPAYAQLLCELHQAGIEWVQMDEPALVLDLPPSWLAGLDQSYATLESCGPKLLLTTYFGSVAQHAARLKHLPVSGLHLDAVRAPEQVAEFALDYPHDKVLSLGVIDGRNVWRCDLSAVLSTLEPVKEQLGSRLWIAPSCSLLHCPMDMGCESALDGELRDWLAFSIQKLAEIDVLRRGLEQGRDAIAQDLRESDAVQSARARSSERANSEVKRRLASLPATADRRSNAFAVRREAQRARLALPLFPTTTIGSFPQTDEIRRARAAYRRNELSEAAYRAVISEEIAQAVHRQEEIGLDVLVHGEAERNDMVEYFAQQLAGFAVTEHGWVQSYGSRCVKPPIIYGDVYRRASMTVDWAAHAQRLTRKPVKGMLTGPVTMLQWSFVRDDQPRSRTALEIALAIRDEVVDLERAGIAIIQIDEPALREGLPLKRAQWDAYLDWAGRAFRVASCGVADRTQIHTHMCYAQFEDILPSIAALDADVITIETSRSQMGLLEAFSDFRYPNEIGPGVYDIHAPRVPTVEEMASLLETAAAVIAPELLWVNPDCGLKTRRWPEVEAALRNMVEAAHRLRSRHRSAVVSAGNEEKSRSRAP